MTQHIVMGMPTEVSAVADLDYIPSKNGRIVVCSQCATLCHIGPEQGKKLDAEGCAVVCAKCIIRSHIEAGMSPDQIMDWYDSKVVVLSDKKMGE